VFVTGRSENTLATAKKELPTGVTTIRSDTSRLEDIDALAATLKAQAGHVDVLFVNETEAEVLERDGIRLSAPIVVKKLGADGCEVNGERIAALAVKALDTTGAGDCFAGGFLSAWLRGSSLADAGRFANAVGALSVSRLGSITGLLNYEETLDWMRRK